jgi:hypothetical protein
MSSWINRLVDVDHFPGHIIHSSKITLMIYIKKKCPCYPYHEMWKTDTLYYMLEEIECQQDVCCITIGSHREMFHSHQNLPCLVILL